MKAKTCKLALFRTLYGVFSQYYVKFVVSNFSLDKLFYFERFMFFDLKTFL